MSVVNPVTVVVGTTIHMTPVGYDSGGVSVPISITQCSLVISTNLATWVRDATGFVITGVGPGIYTTAQVRWTDGVNAVTSPNFTVNVTPPPPPAAIGTTVP